MGEIREGKSQERVKIRNIKTIKTMKKIFFALLTMTVLSSCCGGSGYKITGKAPAAAGDSIYLLTTNRDRAVLASGVVGADSTFTIKGDFVQPEIALLANKDKEPFTMVFVEKGKIKVTATNGQYTISGTPSNDNFKALNDSLGLIQAEFYALGQNATEEQSEALRAKYNKAITEAVSANLDNIFGVYIFANGEYANLEPAAAKARLAAFSEPMLQTESLKKIKESIVATEKTEVGQPYMELSLRDVKGEKLALSSLVGEGKWVLIDFWATWCGPCMGEMPSLQAAYTEFKEKGFNIYGVSLDNDEAAWKEYVTANLPWSNVIAVESDKSSPAATMYGIRSIPSNFLISPEGVIVAKNLRGEALKAKLAEVIK